MLQGIPRDAQAFSTATICVMILVLQRMPGCTWRPICQRVFTFANFGDTSIYRMHSFARETTCKSNKSVPQNITPGGGAHEKGQVATGDTHHSLLCFYFLFLPDTSMSACNATQDAREAMSCLRTRGIAFRQGHAFAARGLEIFTRLSSRLSEFRKTLFCDCAMVLAMSRAAYS